MRPSHRRARVARRLVLLALGVAAALALVHPHARAGAAWNPLADQIAAPFVRLQTDDGRFPDYVLEGIPPTSHAASAMLGYGLLQTGLRNHDEVAIDAGLSAIDYAVTHRTRRKGPGVFDHMAVASAYNLARAHVAGNPLFHRGDWERWIERVPMFWLPNTRHWANKYLVEVVTVLEDLRTGLHSNVRGALLANPRRAQQLAFRYVNRLIPAVARRTSHDVRGEPGFVLSDPSNNALAYHALSFGFFARAVELMGPHASAQARDALRRVAQETWGLTAPDGDIAYVGRSQELSWTLSLAAYGAEFAARTERSTARAAHFRAVTARALARLRDSYGNGPYGLYLTPSLRADAAAARAGLDGYASVPGYAGLTLVGLEWELAAGAGDDGPVGALAADAPGGVRASSGRTALVTLRSGRTWLAVKPSEAFGARDLRYDFGLVSMKRQSPDGTWHDVVPVRPHTRRGPDSAGPLLRSGSGIGLPDATRVALSVSKGVTVDGGFRGRGRRWMRRGVRVRFAPSACGVNVEFSRRPAERVEYSAFFSHKPRVGAGAASDDTQRLAFPGRAGVHVDGGYSSDVDPRLTRVRLELGPGTPRRVTVSECGAG